MKKLLYIILGMVIMSAGTVNALPFFQANQTIVPFQDNKYDLGTTSPTQLRWRNLYLVGSDGCLSLSSGLVVSSGVACGSGGGSGGGTWATTTSSVAGQNINYPLEADDVVVIGSNASTTAEFWFDPNISRAFLSYASSTAQTITSLFTSLFTLDS